MNIINIENIGRIDSFNNRLDIKNGKFSSSENGEYLPSKNGIIVVLSDDDVNNDNCLVKLRGITANILLLPKKYKYTFNDTLTGKKIKPNLTDYCGVSYY